MSAILKISLLLTMFSIPSITLGASPGPSLPPPPVYTYAKLSPYPIAISVKDVRPPEEVEKNPSTTHIYTAGNAKRQVSTVSFNFGEFAKPGIPSYRELLDGSTAKKGELLFNATLHHWYARLAIPVREVAFYDGECEITLEVQKDDRTIWTKRSRTTGNPLAMDPPRMPREQANKWFYDFLIFKQNQVLGLCMQEIFTSLSTEWSEILAMAENVDTQNKTQKIK